MMGVEELTGEKPSKECDFKFRLPITGNTLTTHRCKLKPEHSGDHVCTCGRKIFYNPNGV